MVHLASFQLVSKFFNLFINLIENFDKFTPGTENSSHLEK